MQKPKRSLSSLEVLMFLAGFGVCGILLMGYFVYIVACVRRGAVIERLLKERYLAPPDTSAPDWEKIALVDLAYDGLIRTSRFAWPMAITPIGLWIRMPGMFTICIPWKAMQLVHTSKQGFFTAEFTIEGITRERSIGLKIRSTDQRIGHFIGRCSREINQ